MSLFRGQIAVRQASGTQQVVKRGKEEFPRQQMMQLEALEEVEVDVNDFAAVETLSEANRTNSVRSQPVTPIASDKSPANSIKPSPRHVPLKA